MTLFNAENYSYDWCPERQEYFLTFNKNNWHLQAVEKFIVYVYKNGHWHEFHQMFQSGTDQTIFWQKRQKSTYQKL